MSSHQNITLPFGNLQPFTTDQCSKFPEGTLANKSKWSHCCITHDREYWIGGTYKARHRADSNLYHCVAKAGEPEIAYLMYSGVRVGGSPFINTPWRWGYGWPKLRGYTPLNEHEVDEVIKSIQNP